MAEVYGTKPKKFTKEWWPYFWMYYKWHTITVIIAILLAAVTLYQCATAPKYDVSFTYAGSLLFTDEMTDDMNTDLSSWIDDVDGNGESAVNFQCFTITGLSGNEEYDSAMRMKLDMEFYSDDSYAFIFDSEIMARQFNNDDNGDIYLAVDEWADEMPSEDKLYMIDGVAYAVSLRDSEYLTQKGYKTDDMYAVLRQNYSDDEVDAEAYEQSKKILNELIK